MEAPQISMHKKPIFAKKFPKNHSFFEGDFFFTGIAAMTDPNNYAFEWGPLNQSHGSGGVTFNKHPPGEKWKKIVCK